jgi:hypothetical protein
MQEYTKAEESSLVQRSKRPLYLLPQLRVPNLPNHALAEVGHVLLRKVERFLSPRDRF